jgi:microcompartment protein CcmL/EutN
MEAKMQALGLLETRGLLAAVEGADAMLKAAEVTLLEKTYVGGGLVSIAVTGGVAAVKAAVEAGAAAVNQIGSSLLVSQHVIPRPHEELDELIIPKKPNRNEEVQIAEVETVSITETVEEVIFGEDETANDETANDETAKEMPTEETADNILPVINPDKINKNVIDNLVQEYGFDQALEILKTLKVTKLRNLAREYKNLKIAGRKISKADKKVLLGEFREYYGKN